MKTNAGANNRQDSAVAHPLQHLRKRIARTRVNRRGYKQYSRKLREELVSYAASRSVLGKSYKEIAAELGLPSATLSYWCEPSSQEKPLSRPVGFRPVSLHAGDEGGPAAQPSDSQTPDCHPVVVLPGGVRIEGLPTGELVEFVRRLGCLS